MSKYLKEVFYCFLGYLKCWQWWVINIIIIGITIYVKIFRI